RQVRASSGRSMLKSTSVSGDINTTERTDGSHRNRSEKASLQSQCSIRGYRGKPSQPKHLTD
ncbi:hypothetical protein M9458_001649, partial [Cirrhinus mrigala]